MVMIKLILAAVSLLNDLFGVPAKAMGLFSIVLSAFLHDHEKAVSDFKVDCAHIQHVAVAI
jgi:hypothetical protein